MHQHGDSSIVALGSKFLYKSKCTFGAHSFTSVKTDRFQDSKEVFAATFIWNTSLRKSADFFFLTRRYLIKQVNDLALNLYISIRMRDDLSLLLVISIRLIPPLHNTLEQNYRILCFQNKYEVFHVFIHTFNFRPFLAL